MGKFKKQFLLFKVSLLIFLGLLLFNSNYYIVAMENGNTSNEHANIDNQPNEYLVFQNLLSMQGRVVQQIINALINNASEAEIHVLLNQSQHIHEKIITYQQRQLNIQEEMIRNFDRNMSRIRFERERLVLIQEMMSTIHTTPLYASDKQINVLRNIQIRIEQNQNQINILARQIQNQPNNSRRN